MCVCIIHTVCISVVCERGQANGGSGCEDSVRAAGGGMGACEKVNAGKDGVPRQGMPHRRARRRAAAQTEGAAAGRIGFALVLAAGGRAAHQMAMKVPVTTTGAFCTPTTLDTALHGRGGARGLAEGGWPRRRA